MFDIGSGELMVILVMALLLFGGSLPDVARKLGRSVAELKRGLADSTRPLREAQEDLERDVEGAGEKRKPGGPAGDEPKP